MQAYLFLSHFSSPHELGMCIADSEDDLFWTIDEFANPFEYYFCEADAGDAQVRAVRRPLWDGDYCILDHGDKNAETAIPSRVGIVFSESLSCLGEKGDDGKRQWCMFTRDEEGNRVIRSARLMDAKTPAMA